MTLDELRHKIEQRRAVLGVVGLGYVGLPVACTFANAGLRVLGVDVKPDRIASINAGRNPIEGDEPGLAELLETVVRNGWFHATIDYAELAPADVVLVNVETPVNGAHEPEYAALKTVCRCLGPVLKAGALVIVESTVAPGTMERVVRPLLQASSGKRANVDFYLGACPERVMPGKLLNNLRTLSRVCGGSTLDTAEAMVALYRTIVQADLDVSDLITAEVVKTAENAYRDVQIAFANEVALICEAVGADVWRVRELINKSPSRQMHMPGAGVGGHCIPKDPWLLAYGAGGRAAVRMIPAARAINDEMPIHVAELTVQALREAGCEVARARVAVLGYAYIEDSDDTRNSPSEILVARLREVGAQVVIHDPWVPAYRGDLLQCVHGSDAVVVMVAHRAYRSLDLIALRSVLRTPILVDGRHVCDPAQVRATGLSYIGVGMRNG